MVGLSEGTLIRFGQYYDQAVVGIAGQNVAVRDGQYYYERFAGNTKIVSGQFYGELIAPYDTAARILFNSMSGEPTSGRKALYNDLIVGLKADGNWDSLDLLYILAAHDSADALINIRSPGANTITLTDSPLFTADQGYLTDGSNDVLDLNFNPATAGGNFAQNSACFGIWSRTSALVTASRAGWFDGTDGVTINPRGSSDTVQFRINQAAQSSTANSSNADGTGLYVTNRSASDATQVYKNGLPLSVTSNANQTSTTLNSHNLQLGSVAAASFAATQFAACYAGASRTAAQQMQIYNRILAFLQAVGAA